MRISKAIKPILVALGAQASEIGGKSLSKIANYVAPFAVDFIEKTKSGEYGGNDEFVVNFSISEDQSGDMDEGQIRLETDITPQEIIEAYNQNKELKATVPTEGGENHVILNNLMINDLGDKGFVWYAATSASSGDSVNYFTMNYQAAEVEGTYVYQAIMDSAEGLIFEENPYDPLIAEYTLNRETGVVTCGDTARSIAIAYDKKQPIVARLNIDAGTMNDYSNLTIGSVVYTKNQQGQRSAVSIVYNVIDYTGNGNDATYMSVVHTYDYTTNQDSIQYYDKKFTVSNNS